MDLSAVERNFAKDLTNLNVLIDDASRRLEFGSRSERRPDLGRMFTCPYCHVRRLRGSRSCCYPNYSVAHEGPSKKFIKKFSHKRHGQNRMFVVRQLVKLFESDVRRLREAVEEMQVRSEFKASGFVPSPAHVAAFTQRYILWKEAKSRRASRMRTKRSRKINRQES